MWVEYAFWGVCICVRVLALLYVCGGCTCELPCRFLIHRIVCVSNSSCTVYLIFPLVCILHLDI